ncbi:MAG: hypothetical protein ABFC67_07790 [Mizugakiibacter sp.]|uniref:hypothetical protein n=1 Tax=Mizugakiibacter sp. TaxID=1972610 RepID=UPI0031BF5A3F|nr:hypothetical protein [Xanthomonadaceae bacterium]
MKKLLVAAAFAALLLSGCSLFHHKNSAWERAVEERPLEVPPDLDTPPTSAQLVVPPAGDAAAAAPAAAGAPPSAGVGDSLSVTDDVESAYRRVGLALERAGVGTVVARDAAAHSYQVAVQTTVVHEKQGGFFHRLFSRKKTETVTGNVSVTVGAEGSGSKVQLEGDRAAVQQLLTALKARLG